MTEQELRLLVENKAPLRVIVQRVTGAARARPAQHADQAPRQEPAAYVVGVNDKMLRSARQEVRRFARLDTVAAALAAAGVQSFSVNLGDAPAPRRSSRQQMTLPEA